jgi:hypothetical protein
MGIFFLGKVVVLPKNAEGVFFVDDTIAIDVPKYEADD